MQYIMITTIFNFTEDINQVNVNWGKYRRTRPGLVLLVLSAHAQFLMHVFLNFINIFTIFKESMTIYDYELIILTIELLISKRHMHNTNVNYVLKNIYGYMYQLILSTVTLITTI